MGRRGIEICMIHVLIVSLHNVGNTEIQNITFWLNSDISEARPQFSLTCISTGGPATTVTWTRDSATAMGDEMTVLDNATTVQYTHTLTVTGRLGGLYQCTVSNDKPSSDSASLTVQGMLLHTFYYVMLQ